MYNKFDSYYYSRPVSYRSYNTRVSRPEVLNISDPESTQVLELLAKYKINVNNLGGLARGIQFGDLVVERRVFNHNSTAYYAGNDYVIRQWKATNDLSKEHPTGTHTVLKSFPELLARLEKVVQEQSFKAQ
jgi:hypothetical protein